MGANKYGLHRVIWPKGALPQSAARLDISLPIFQNEVLMEVQEINIDSTSFRQMAEAASQDPEKIKKAIFKIVEERGKLHNPVTNSGGMLLGKVKEIGQHYRGALQAKVGEAVATLVSLTLTPLYLESIESIDFRTGQLKALGYAILFESGIAHLLPADLPEKIALAVLDICGAPALVLRHAQKNDRVLFVGAGKSAKLSAAALKRNFGDTLLIHALDVSEKSLSEMKSMSLADEVFVGDATQAEVIDELPLQMYDLVVNVANVPGTEMASVLAVKEGGKVLFFSMATEFGKVALGAEGIGKDASFFMGSGYVKGHADLALRLVRENKKLRKWFEEKYL